jgi:hypothetical protein
MRVFTAWNCDAVDVESDTIALLAVLRPVDVDVDSDTIALVAVPKPTEVDVDSDTIVLLALFRPAEVDVDSDTIALLAVLRPVEVDVDSDTIALLAATKPVDVDVDSDVTTEAATPAPPLDEAPLESEVMALTALLSPDDSDTIELTALLTLLDTVVIVLAAAMRPVDSEAMLVATFDATAYNWLPLTASVDVAETCPAATFLIWRSAPGAPTETTPATVPAKPVYVTPLTVAEVTLAGMLPPVVEPAPMATLFASDADALVPSATEFDTAVAVSPIAMPPGPVA